jgi:sugar phosphate isomerase/epimerase
MKLEVMRHLWGIDEPWDRVFPKIKDLGYAGIESPLPDSDRAAEFGKLLEQHGFAYVAMIFTGGTTVDEHLKSFVEQVERAKRLRPSFINAHSGSDRWSADDAKRFYDRAIAIQSEAGIRITHETHRGRVFYNPWITRDVILALPALELTCDYSHWVCVAERLIDSELEILKLCADHAHHIHARVGYEQGPQVPDPRAPEYQRHVEAHERWWDLVWASQERRGFTTTTLTPEFGPSTYLHTLPFTNVPVADLWDVCNWQAKRQKERFLTRNDRKGK